MEFIERWELGTLLEETGRPQPKQAAESCCRSLGIRDTAHSGRMRWIAAALTLLLAGVSGSIVCNQRRIQANKPHPLVKVLLANFQTARAKPFSMEVWSRLGAMRWSTRRL